MSVSATRELHPCTAGRLYQNLSPGFSTSTNKAGSQLEPPFCADARGPRPFSLFRFKDVAISRYICANLQSVKYADNDAKTSNTAAAKVNNDEPWNRRRNEKNPKKGSKANQSVSALLRTPWAIVVPSARLIQLINPPRIASLTSCDMLNSAHKTPDYISCQRGWGGGKEEQVENAK